MPKIVKRKKILRLQEADSLTLQRKGNPEHLTDTTYTTEFLDYSTHEGNESMPSSPDGNSPSENTASKPTLKKYWTPIDKR
jgi:hypothetical protein